MTARRPARAVAPAPPEGLPCADVANCPHAATCREARDRARLGPSYDRIQARAAEVAAAAPPLSGEQLARLRVLLAPPPGGQPPVPCPLAQGGAP